jgi:hypothetical protein
MHKPFDFAIFLFLLLDIIHIFNEEDSQTIISTDCVARWRFYPRGRFFAADGGTKKNALAKPSKQTRLKGRTFHFSF